MGAEAPVGVRHVGVVGADLPEPELGAHRTEAVPDFQRQPLLGQLRACGLKLFHGAVAEENLGEFIDSMAGKIFRTGVGQLLQHVGEVVPNPDKVGVLRFGTLDARGRSSRLGFRRRWDGGFPPLRRRGRGGVHRGMAAG